MLRKKVKGYINYDEKRYNYSMRFLIGKDFNTGFTKYKTKNFKNKKDAKLFKKNMGGFNYGN